MLRFVRTFCGVLLAAFGSIAAQGNARADVEIPIAVTLRPSAAAQVVVSVRENPRRNCRGGTVIAVHGLAHTGRSIDPLAEQVLKVHSPICKVAILDLPGHGKSPLPTGIAFGELLLDDYVTAILGVLAALPAEGVSTQGAVLLGHSMGGLLVQMTQTRLLAGGQSLRRRHGITTAVVISPSPAAEHPWAFVESGQAATVLAPYLTVDPQKGLVLRADPLSFLAFFFANLSGQISPYAPSPADVTTRYLNDESGYAGLQLLGQAPLSRPVVGNRPFALRHGTLLLYVNPSQDPFSIRTEARAAYVQLTGDRGLFGFLEVDDPYAVHDMHVAQPASFLREVILSLF